MARSEAQKRAGAKYDAKNTRFFGLKLNRATDADLIIALEAADSMQAFVKAALREYIGRHGGPVPKELEQNGPKSGPELSKST